MYKIHTMLYYYKLICTCIQIYIYMDNNIIYIKNEENFVNKTAS